MRTTQYQSEYTANHYTRHKSKLALEQMLRDAAQTTARQQLSLDTDFTVAELREQLSAALRKARKFELEANYLRSVVGYQPLPEMAEPETSEECDRETVIAKAKAYLKQQGYIVFLRTEPLPAADRTVEVRDRRSPPRKIGMWDALEEQRSRQP
jgi:hypothetical protein